MNSWKWSERKGAGSGEGGRERTARDGGRGERIVGRGGQGGERLQLLACATATTLRGIDKWRQLQRFA